MAQLTASRTLVKSSPELWAECSDAAALARHLGAFGEIQITKLEPETAVAWEGEAVCGTVTLEPSGWGTRVVLTAEVPTPAVGVAEPATDVAAATDPVVAATTEPARSGFFRRLFGGWRRAPYPGPESDASDTPTGSAAAVGADAKPAEGDSPSAQALVGALDSLGRAHRRPFSHG